MFKAKKVALAAFTAVALMGCGGGDGDADTIDARTKYVGEWQSGCEVYGRTSERSFVTFSLRGSDELKMAVKNIEYANTDCSGDVLGTNSSDDAFKFVGTKLDSEGQEVDSVTMSAPDDGDPLKAILAVRNNRLYAMPKFPDEDVPVDANGFPTTFPSDYLSRL